MTLSVFAHDLAVLLAGLFAVAAVLNLSGAGFLVRAYRRGAFARGFQYVAGAAQALASLFLAVPQTRVWGGALGAIILFVTVVSLLNHRKYAYAVPAILVMLALAPAMV